MKEDSAQKISDIIFDNSELKNCKTLEIGCGSGRISAILSSKANRLVAIDPDEKAINKAAENVSGVDFRVGSGEALDFPDSFFDVVIFTLSLHHQNCRKALGEATRVLKSDGKIIIIEPVAEGEIESVFSFLVNEDKEKAFAQECILNSELKLIKSEFFSSTWVFENNTDLLTSVFEYYNMPFNINIAKKISNYLGLKIKSKPIVCEDKMIIQILSM
jgi:ubiquinone/menaquinone biosynthesis C-methylase UbiE